MSLILTHATVEKFVRISLGEPVIEVELTSEQIELLTDHAAEVYGTFKPAEKEHSINILPNKQKYDILPADLGKGIIEVFRPDLLRQPISLDQFDVFKYHTHLPNLDPGDFYAERIWWKAVRRSAGSDDDYYLFRNPNTGDGFLYVNPIPSSSYVFHYLYVVDPSLTEVPPSDDDWIKSYTLALCKETLGLIRSKFQSIDGAESSLNMDGELLRQEGKESKTELEEYITDRGQLIAPLRG